MLQLHKWSICEPSPSARRAGIEITNPHLHAPCRWSPSARRAGIEIDRIDAFIRRCRVALREEGGD